MVIRFRRLANQASAAGIASMLLGWTGAGAVHAQLPMLPQPAVEQPVPPDSGPQVNYLNKSHIRLPIQISDAGRSALQEVQLYIKERHNAPWTLRDKVAPTQKAFAVHLPKDGQYDFTMVTVDRQGRRIPEDLRNEQAGLIVVIDTQAPQVTLTNLGQTPDGQLVRFEIHDGNLNNARTQFAFQAGDRTFRNLEPIPGRPNVYCVPSQAVFTGLIRATAEDLAGNATVMEEHISKLPSRPAMAMKAQPTPNSVLPVQAPGVNPPVIMEANDPPATAEAPQLLPDKFGGAPTVTPSMIDISGPKHVAARPDPECRVVEHSGPQLLPKTQPTGPAVKRQIVNRAKLFLDYQLENVGPSGVSKLQFWITRDEGKSWSKLSETANQASPLEVTLPGEGLFGVTLVACNGRGLPGAAPKAGEAPDWWIEVDTTRPKVEISKIMPLVENGAAVVHIQWTAHDKNLGDTPVDLFYAATPTGPWLPIAKGLKGDGSHRWTPPAEIGAQVHMRLVARDAAGNPTTLVTQEPIAIGDQLRPRAVIRNVSTSMPTTVPVTTGDR